MNLPTHSRITSGFTLIELLTVITLVAILAALGASLVGGASSRADTVECLSNLRQLGMAASLYSQDHAMDVVPGNTGNPNLNWYHYLRPYVADRAASRADLGSAQQYFICPADPSEGGAASLPNHNDWRSYGINIQTLEFFRDNGRRLKIIDVEQPAKTILAGDLDITQANSNWIGSDVHFYKLPATWHDGKVNILMMDGHARSIERTLLAKDAAASDLWLVDKPDPASP